MERLYTRSELSTVLVKAIYKEQNLSTLLVIKFVCNLKYLLNLSVFFFMLLRHFVFTEMVYSKSVQLKMSAVYNCTAYKFQAKFK